MQNVVTDSSAFRSTWPSPPGSRPSGYLATPGAATPVNATRANGGQPAVVASTCRIPGQIDYIVAHAEPTVLHCQRQSPSRPQERTGDRKHEGTMNIDFSERDFASFSTWSILETG